MDQVYIFDFGDKIKVGFSTNVEKRLRTIELSSGVKAKQVYSVPASRKEEKLLHSWLTNRLEGEFFAFPFDEAQQILDKIIRGDITAAPTTVKIKAKGRITFSKLQQIMAERNIKKFDLRKAGFNPNIIDKVLSGNLDKNKRVDTETINRLCEYFEVQPGDIMEYVEETE